MEPQNLTVTERAILANQFNILAKLAPNEADYHERNIEILERGYEGLYSNIFQHYSDPVPKEVTSEVHDILSMYKYITPAISNLSEEEQAEIRSEEIKFEGFDANNDTHYSIADFYINQMGLYKELKDTYLNSHSQIPLIKYKRMLSKFKQIQASHTGFFNLSKNDLIELIQASKGHL